MEARKPRKTLVGRVVSDKMDKTVTISVERLVQHPVYRKIVKKTSKIYAHDEENQCKVGDKVKVMSTRPLSKNKRWRVVEIIERAK
ncbi:MAG: 30S ribosomal protein S17 [Candidatus Latescibacteria bacterium 4484_7]|nr:MAG: 30S ribosomal protein S17 [Candidatus Latescibacteria bacterium 4484_7]